MVYPRQALALVLLLAACPGEGGSTSDTEASTGSSPTSDPTAGGEEGPCPGGGSPCGSECVFLGSDEANCGVCGNVCGQGEECIAAQCVDLDPCDGGPGTPCGPDCVDIESDPNHCGDCYQDCDEGQSCAGGMCMGGGEEVTGPPPETTDSGPMSTSDATTGDPGSTSDPGTTGATGTSGM